MDSRQRSSAACRQCRSSKVRCDVSRTGTPCSRCRLRNETNCQLLPSRRGAHNRSKLRERNGSEQSEQFNAEQLSASRSGSHQEALNAQSTDGRLVRPSPGEIIVTSAQTARRESNTHSASSEGPSWAGVFETLLKARGKDNAIGDASITFLGETFPLTHLLGSVEQDGIRLHHPVASSSDALPSQHDYPTHLSSEDLQCLKLKDCLSIPPKDCLEVLIAAFVEKVYPIYPVVILEDFLDKYRSKSLPLILMHAACCAGSSFCSLAQLTPLGYTSRQEVRDTFYHRAKLLFDFGYEDNKITILQSTTLLSFWPSGPQDVWSFYQWIGFSTTLAESLGIHRSLAHVNMPDRNRALLKRIWSVLDMRDAWGAALFGRPLRINEAQCDADQVTLDDFQHDTPNAEPSTETQRLYFIHAASLTAILRPTFRIRSYPAHLLQQQHFPVDMLRTRLQQWRESVPTELDWKKTSSVFAAILSILFHNTLILAHLPIKPSTTALGQTANVPSPFDTEGSVEIVQQGAETILSTASMLVTQNELISVPHEMYTGIFLASVLLYKNANSSDSSASKLTGLQMTSFQMIFNQMKETWEPAAWIMHLFKILAERSNGSRTPFPPVTMSEWAEMPVFSADSFADTQPYLGDLGIFDQAWANHPVLTSLFEQWPDPLG